MSQDPFLEREAEKYESPIPSREYILAHLAKEKRRPAAKNWATNWASAVKSSWKRCVAACAPWSAMAS